MYVRFDGDDFLTNIFSIALKNKKQNNNYNNYN